MTKIFMHVPDEFGCGHYRAKFPAINCFSELSKSGCYIDWSTELTIDETNYDAYIFHRVPNEGLAFHVDFLKQKNKKIIWQVDDDLWNIPKWMPSEETKNQWGLNKVLELADQIWVSTDKLKHQIDKKNVKVLPNLIDTNYFNRIDPLDDPIRILWCGGRSHEKDLDMLIGPLERLFSEYLNRIQMVFWGYIPTKMLEFARKEGTMFADVRPKSEYGDRVWFLDGLPFRNFYDKLSQIRPYITLCPLIGCEFNQSKTNLKYLEMTMAGGASVASDLLPYQCIEHGIDGLLVNNSPDDWYNAIRTLIEDRGLRDSIANNAYNKVHNEYSWQSDKKQLWIDAFRSIL